MNNLKGSDFIKNKEFEGTLFQLKGINADGKDSIIYGFVQEQTGNDIYIVYSRTFFYFLQYCKDQVKGVPDIQAGKQGAVLDKVKGDKGIFATKMDVKSFSDMLLNRKISISSIKSEKGQISQGEKANSVDVKNTFFLGKLSDDGKVEDLFKTTDTSKLKLSIDSVGGFKDIRTLTNKKYEGDFVPVTKLQ